MNISYKRVPMDKSGYRSEGNEITVSIKHAKHGQSTVRVDFGVS